MTEKLSPEQMRDLRGRPDREFSVTWLKLCDHTPGFQRVGHQPLVVETLFDHAVGLGEGVVDVAAGNRPCEGLVAAELFVQKRGAVSQRRLGRVDGVERVVVHLDEFSRVPGGI